MQTKEQDSPDKKLIFKNVSFQRKSQAITISNKKRIWRSLKQILTQEKALPWSSKSIHYSSINAPLNLKPSKKYSDISGLKAHYTDPQTKLYYANKNEFNTIQSLPMDIAAGYLTLRGASSVV